MSKRVAVLLGIGLAVAGAVLVDVGALMLGALTAQVFGWTLVLIGIGALLLSIPVADRWF